MRALSCVYALIPPERVTALVNNTSRCLRQCCGSIVPFRPGGAERSGFLQASTLDVMEVDHDLRKFIAETPVAQRRGMLSSGREASGNVRSPHRTVQRRTVSATRGTRAGAEVELQIDNVGRLTPGAGIRSSTAMGSDLWAAEALQEAETEVGVGND
jgi:hypothetical protein